MRTRVVVTLAAVAVVGGAALAFGAIPGGDTTRTPTPTPSPNVPTLQEVDGGTDYYSQFKNGLPTDPGFFPILLWGAYNLSPANIATDKSRGINTYGWPANARTTNDLANIRAAGMNALVEVDDSTAPVGTETKGWFLHDEADMMYKPGWDGWNGGDWNSCIPPQDKGGKCGYTVMQRQKQKAQAIGDGRMTWANYGKDMYLYTTATEAGTFLNDPRLSPDVASIDIYFHTDPWFWLN